MLLLSLFEKKKKSKHSQDQLSSSELKIAF